MFPVSLKSIDELPSGMSPTSIHGNALQRFKLVIAFVAVCLGIALIVSEKFASDLAATAATVVVEHDITGQAVTHAPFIALAGLMLLVVYHRNHTFVNLDVFALQYLFSQKIIQQLEPFDRRLVPFSHRGVTYHDPGLLVLLYLAVERKVVHELSYYDVRQDRGSGKASEHWLERKRCYEYFSFFRQLAFNI